MPAPEVVSGLAARFGATAWELGVEVASERLLELLRALRDGLGYRYYVMALGADRGDRLELVHAVRNLDSGDTLFVKVRLGLDDPAVPSAAFVYAGAEWHERETYDLLGIRFLAHPDPRRLLLPDEYEGHPLRKAFAMDTPWGYRPATREASGGASG